MNPQPPQQQFCLKWNNYQSNMSEVFQSMLVNENLVDVTLACEGASLKAHKMVLAACSPYFQSLFVTNPCKHPIVILKDVRFIDLKAIIDFMYRGEVNVSQDQLPALLKTAETLKVKGLAEVTEKQARGQPQLQNALFGTGRKRRRRNRKVPKGETSESEDENTAPSKRHSDARPPSQRLGSLKLAQERDQQQAAGEQIEPSRILEQSMATAEVGGAENGQEGVMVAADVSGLDEEVAGHNLFAAENMNDGTEAMMLTAGPSSGSQATIIVFGQGAGAASAPNALNNMSSGGQQQQKAGSRVSNVGKFECDLCKLRFASNYNLKRHLRIHDTERPRWQCSFCDKNFTRRDSLPKHINFVHKDQMGGLSISTAGDPDSPSSDQT